MIGWRRSAQLLGDGLLGNRDSREPPTPADLESSRSRHSSPVGTWSEWDPKESEELLRALGESASDMVTVFGPDGRFLYVSPNRKQILGRPPAAFLGHTIHELAAAGELHQKEAHRLLERFESLASGKGRGPFEYRLRHGDGSWRWFESTGRLYVTQAGAPRVLVMSRDVTERRRVLDQLSESLERSRVLTQATGELVIESDFEGRVTYASEVCEELLGYPAQELVGTTPIALLFHPDDAEPTVAAFLDAVDAEAHFETPPFRMRHRDGRWRWFVTSGVPYRRAEGEMRMLSITRDVTLRLRDEQERREFSEQMQQVQRLESLGVMAGGIAHDFNNLLTPILGEASLAILDLPESSPVRARLEKIRSAAQRAAGLTNQMLAYAGRRPLVAESLDLSSLVREVGQLLETPVSGRGSLSIEIPTNLPAVVGDATQITQVALNLITNAAEAVSAPNGRIWVRAGVLGSEEIPRSALFPGEAGEAIRPEPGPYLFFEVEDDGCGMDEATRSRIFDPFFTTKFTGRGLGLAAVLGIVRGHRGAIDIESAPGKGTRFRVLLPAAHPESVGAASTRESPDDSRVRGTVLVVDDDEGVRALVEETLRRAGIAAVSATDGDEAISLFERGPDDIDVVLLDRTMPASGGAACFEALRRIRPSVPIVLMSGYAPEHAAEGMTEDALSGFLQKPFLPETLIERIREALAS
jgi:two-component system cell cycle sensor histidine kinase/response regulator CckA